MANRTLVQLRDQIKAERPEIQEKPEFPALFLTRLVNDGQKYVQIQLAHLGIKQWEAIDDLTLTGGTIAEIVTVSSDLSTDCPSRLFDGKESIKSLDCTGSGGGQGIAHYVDDDVFLEHARNTYLAPVEKEPIFTRTANQLHILPSTVTSVSATYYKSTTDLSADADKTTIPENFEPFIIKKSIIEIDSILKKLENKVEAINQLSKDIKDSFAAMQMAEVKESDVMRLQ